MRAEAQSPTMVPRTARWAAALLPYVNLLLMMVAGAGLATAARLTWDPSTSIPLRLALPQEHRVVRVLLAVCPLALLLLAALAQAGLHSAGRRRPALLSYVAGMVLLMTAEVATGAWLGVRVYRFATEDALVPELLNVLRVGGEILDKLNEIFPKLDHILSPVIEFIKNELMKLSPQLMDILFSDDLQRLLKEIPADLPCNVYVGVACVLVGGALQPLAALLAWLAASTGRACHRPASKRDNDTLRWSRVRPPERPQDKPSHVPRCLRPMSTGDHVTEDLPLATALSKGKEGQHSLRTGLPCGWQRRVSGGRAGSGGSGG